MPNIARRQLLANLQASLAPTPERDAETELKAALAAAQLKDKPFFTPEETALVGRALMERAQAEMQAAMAKLEAELPGFADEADRLAAQDEAGS